MLDGNKDARDAALQALRGKGGSLVWQVVPTESTVIPAVHEWWEGNSSEFSPGTMLVTSTTKREMEG